MGRALKTGLHSSYSPFFGETKDGSLSRFLLFQTVGSTPDDTKS